MKPEPMSSTRVLKTDWKTHQTELSAIRIQVFVDEQQVPVADEWDGLDEAAIHYLVLDENRRPLGGARLLVEEKAGSTHLHIGRVAILKPWRGKGLGTALMRFVIEHCKELGSHSIYLHAQCERQGFYENLGFVAEGDVFMDAGIPHIAMRYHN